MAATKSAMESMEMNPQFWSKKRVLITGHTGFKGGWLSLWLHMAGAHVIGFSLPPPTQPSLFNSAKISKHLDSIVGDIRDFDHLQKVFDEHRPEIVLHLAAQAIVRDSYKDPLSTYDTNIMGTVKVLEAVRRADSVRAVVVITSDKCYENQEWDWGYREVDPLGGFDPYSSSKGCAELVTSAYMRSFFTSRNEGDIPATMIASARAGNVIGGGDWATDRLVPDIMKSFMAGKPVTIRNPTAIRPWQYVLEPLRGYLMLAERLWSVGSQFKGAWNFGPEDFSARPVGWIVDRLATMWGSQSQWEFDGGQHPHEAHYLKLDCSKAKSRLRWQPLMDLPQTLELIVQWYQAFQDNGDMYEETCRQIRCYEKLIEAGSDQE